MFTGLLLVTSTLLPHRSNYSSKLLIILFFTLFPYMIHSLNSLHNLHVVEFYVNRIISSLEWFFFFPRLPFSVKIMPVTFSCVGCVAIVHSFLRGIPS